MTESRWGGGWTRTKLDILAAYLDAYTRVLKKKRGLKLWYIDAFAGTGTVVLEDEEGLAFLDGSAQIALDARDRHFDRLIFIERDDNKADQLERLPHLPPQEVVVRRGDANREVHQICGSTNWRSTRAVAFIDPFATQTDWATIAALAATEAVDTWILFPVQAIRRMLPNDALPDSISPHWAGHLDRIFGDDSWRGLYSPSPQFSMFDDRAMVAERGFEGIVTLYRKRLETVFTHVAPQSRRLVNQRGSPLFEFMFAAGNPKGGKIAVRIAGHILDNL
ncbi:MAG: three-Cys-motif partner protein TcmP [Gammaproteobacteria bacterium]|nr:three-Cys-motif partner protein TcmP [Gammaproteobacteria bacterium]